MSKPDLDKFRRDLELYILDEARRRGIERCALHVDVAPLEGPEWAEFLAGTDDASEVNTELPCDCTDGEGN